MVYLNLYIAHVQLILDCLGTDTVWPKFITGTFKNSFCWSGCRKGLWGRETWVFAEKIMSRACLRGQLDVALYMSVSSLHTASSQAQNAACKCLLWTPGELISVLVYSEATHVLCLGQLLWAGLGWAESWPCSVVWVFPQNYSKTHPRTTDSSNTSPHTYATELEAFWLTRPAGRFSLCLLLPQGSAHLKFLVIFITKSANPSLPVYSSTHPSSSSLPDVYLQTLPKIIHMEGTYRGIFSAVLFPSLFLAFQFLCFASDHAPRQTEGPWLMSAHVGSTQGTFCSRSFCFYFCFLGLKSLGFLPKFSILAQPNNPICVLCVTLIQSFS